ncbi:MAG: Gldg family protein [Planctomycetota bacterium]
MNLTVLKAIFKRDFVNYFSNATGYVFICVFVLLSSLATIWPEEFFSNNLANLDQLTNWMPYILLVFVPAITMGSWAEERRRGTDELLLTLPASDADVVIGKYLANVAIFTVSLLFSMASIRLIFAYGLGSPDTGLFCCTYLGYWFVGIGMIAVGMVASFLTSNLTVSFILGLLFNAPQALAQLFSFGDAEWLNGVVRSGLNLFDAYDGFADFSRGVVSVGGVTHFVCIIALMLYLCMVLIGRRHWSGGSDGPSLGLHYLARGATLLVALSGLSATVKNTGAGYLDMTSARLNSLSPNTIALARELGQKEDLPPIRIDAYVSPQVPSEYAKQKRELLNTLSALRSAGGGKIVVATHEIENFSEEATVAETNGIDARPVETKVRGVREQEEIFLGASFRCGLDKVVLPFLDKGLPVEYELVRSITTVADEKRKTLGVVRTDAQLFSSFSMQGPSEESRLITELKKQYDVKEVDPSKPIEETFDVLLAVQPSSLSPEALDNFVAAVKTGQPTAIFEDPFPVAWNVVGTDQPKPPAGGMMGMFGGGGPPPPKGDMQQLWKLLGVRFNASDLIVQDHNPYKAQNFITDEWVFVDVDSGAQQPFNSESPITAGLKQVLFLYTGAAESSQEAGVTFTPLAVTNGRTATEPVRAAQAFLQQQSPAAQYRLRASRRATGKTYVLAAEIKGQVEEQQKLELNESIDDEALRKELAGEAPAADGAGGGADPDSDTPDAADDAVSKVHAVLVADIDGLSNDFFAIRAIGPDERLDVDWRFQNVTFVLNILDSLAGDDRYIDVRKRTRDYRTLTELEAATESARDQAADQEEEFIKLAKDEIEAARASYRKEIAKIQNDASLTPAQREQKLRLVGRKLERQRDVKIAGLTREQDKQIKQNQRDLAATIRSVQDRYKLAAVIVPPVLPILLACWVYFRRRSREQEGVAKERLRYAQHEPTKPAAAAS